jgi:O-antigen/teichoic acid export membrane protein
MSSLKFFLNDSKFYLFSKVFQGLLFIFNLKVFTFFLQPIDYGQFSSLHVTLTIFVLFSTAWIGASIIRLSPKEKSNPLFFSSLMILLIITLLITTIFLFIFFNLFSTIFKDKNIYFYLNIIFYYYSACIYNYLLNFYRADREPEKYAIIVLFQSVSSLVFPILSLLVFKDSIMSIFISLSLSNILPILWILKNKSEHLKSLKWDKKYISEILSYGLPAIFIQLFVSLTMFSDQLILKYFNFHEQVGIYAANYTLIDKSINIISSVFITSLQPILFEIWENETPQKAYVFFKKILGIYLLIAISICFSMYFLYNFIVKYILSPSYNIGNLFIYIMIGSLLLSLSNFFSEILNVNKKTGLIAIIYGITFTISFITNIFFVPSMGMKGTALVNILSYSMLFIGMGISSKYYLQKSKT